MRSPPESQLEIERRMTYVIGQMTTKEVSYDLPGGSDKVKEKTARAPRDSSLDALAGPTLFGSSIRGDILVMVAALGRTYPRELARLVDRPISMTQKIVADFERSGVLASRRIGTIREVTLNPEFIVAKELKELLSMLLEKEPRYSKRLLTAARRRPRRSGKAL